MQYPNITRFRPSLQRIRRKFRDFLYFTVPEILVIAGATTVLLRLIDRFFFRR